MGGEGSRVELRERLEHVKAALQDHPHDPQAAIPQFPKASARLVAMPDEERWSWQLALAATLVGMLEHRLALVRHECCTPAAAVQPLRSLPSALVHSQAHAKGKAHIPQWGLKKRAKASKYFQTERRWLRACRLPTCSLGTQLRPIGSLSWSSLNVCCVGFAAGEKA